jgi:hypothetical protein
VNCHHLHEEDVGDVQLPDVTLVAKLDGFPEKLFHLKTDFYFENFKFDSYAVKARTTFKVDF